MMLLTVGDFWQGLAAIFSGLALWAQHRADPVEDVTAQVRRPLRWALWHPVLALRRFIVRS